MRLTPLVTFALALALAAPVPAARLGAPADAVPAGTEVLASVSIGPGGIRKVLAAWTAFPDVTGPIADEHIAGFAKEWGVDLNAPVKLTLAMPPGQPDRGLFSGTFALDVKVLAAALKARLPQAKVEETADGFTVQDRGGAVLVGKDGTVRAGKKELVLGRAMPTPESTAFAGELAERAGEAATFAVLMKLPKGLPGAPPPALAGVQGLWPRVRAAFVSLRANDLVAELRFDDPEAAKATLPVLQGALKSLEGALGAKAAEAEAEARKHQPVNWMDPQWMAAKFSLATTRALAAKVALTVDGPRLALSVPAAMLPSGNPLVTTAIAGVLAGIAVPNFKAARDRANDRACFANQRTIMGAIEMYQLDKNQQISQLDAAAFETLRAGGYLQTIPQDPGQGPGTASHYVLGAKGVECTFHGTMQAPKKAH